MAVAMKALYIFFGLIVFLSANSHADSNYSYEDRLISALDLFLSQDYIASESKLKKLINEYENSTNPRPPLGDAILELH